MGMAADELAVEVVEDVGDGEVALVGGHLGVEEDLQNQVAEFLGQVGKVAALDGVEDFVGLFKGVFADGVEGLFAVPWAAARSAKTRHDGDGLLKEGCRSRRIGLESGRGGFWTGCA
jgi:hypothetical protein